eukprot:COSAG04_NODE_144_length_22941_cov_54.823614_14_plen_154_part_00
MPPQLFMDPATDVGDDSWGLMVGRPTALTPDARLALPPVNYTAGATVFAAFTTRADPTEYEVFVASGRPGEPLLGSTQRDQPGGVSVDRFTTSDFMTYSKPVTVLFLPNAPSDKPPPPPPSVGQERARLGDGAIWTVTPPPPPHTHTHPGAKV